MKPNPLRQVLGMPLDAMHRPHLQRWVERWLRRWGFAVWGFMLGLCVVVLADPQVGEDHAQAAQMVASLQQSLAEQSQVAVKPEKALSHEAKNLLASLPGQARRGDMGADWQRLLATQGVRLQSLRPLPPNAAEGGHGVLPSQAVALRVLGRFEDWAKVWAACAATGPVCSLDRISVAATANPGEVQIDAVLRVWMRAAQSEKGEGPDRASAWSGQAELIAQEAANLQLFGRSVVSLFALDHEGAASSATAASRMAASAVHDENGVTRVADAAGAVGTSNTVAWEALPKDLHQWPLARVRLAGLWQHGADRQAILSAGTHWAQVRVGQRVTREGHRVAVIAHDGVRLRLGPGPLLKLDWLGEHGGDLAKGDGSNDQPLKTAPSKEAPSKEAQPAGTSTRDHQPLKGDPR